MIQNAIKLQRYSTCFQQRYFKFIASAENGSSPIKIRPGRCHFYNSNKLLDIRNMQMNTLLVYIQQIYLKRFIIRRSNRLTDPELVTRRSTLQVNTSSNVTFITLELPSWRGFNSFLYSPKTVQLLSHYKHLQPQR